MGPTDVLETSIPVYDTKIKHSLSPGFQTFGLTKTGQCKINPLDEVPAQFTTVVQSQPLQRDAAVSSQPQCQSECDRVSDSV